MTASTEIALPEQMFGRGVTEDFRRADPTELVAAATAAARTGKDRMPTPLEYLPSLERTIGERHNRLVDTGFSALAMAESRRVPFELARTLYTELTGDELTMWRKFLPTRQSTHAFDYDSIPDEALGHIRDAQTLNFFDRIDIWTPAGNDVDGRIARMQRQIDREREVRRQAMARRFADPMAVGVLRDSEGNDHWFAIVRWGESLMAVDKIKQYVSSVDKGIRDRMTRWSWQLAGSALLIAGILAALIAFDLWSILLPDSVGWWPVLTFYAGIIITLVVGCASIAVWIATFRDRLRFGSLIAAS